MTWSTKSLAVALAVAGCSDGDNGGSMGGDGRSGMLWEQYCHAEAARRAGCGQTDELQGCLDDRACIEGVYRPDVVDSLTRCLSARACGEGDDACFSQAAAPHESDPAVVAYQSACLQRRSECNVGGQSFSDDLCANTGLALPVVQDELAQCLSQPCDQIQACLGGVLDARGC
jgi:hypothetical protein